MKKRSITATLLALLSAAAAAETTGVSIVNFDNNFQTLQRNGIEVRAGEPGIGAQIEDAQNDTAKPLDQINNFIANGVDAIIVMLVGTASSPALTAAAEKAGIPLVYINLEPQDLSALPPNQVHVGSNEIESGTLGAFEACKLLRAQRKAVHR